MNRHEALTRLIQVRKNWPETMYQASNCAPDDDPSYEEDWWWHETDDGITGDGMALLSDNYELITKDDWINALEAAINRPTEWPPVANILVQTSEGKWVFGTYRSTRLEDGVSWVGEGIGHWLFSGPVHTMGIKPAGWDWTQSLQYRPETPTIETTPEEPEMAEDPGKHYRKVIRAPVTYEDYERGYVEVKADPYRICALYDTGGGPREHLVNKGLRGESKGQTELELVHELRSVVERWIEMLEEDHRLETAVKEKLPF